MTALTKMTVCEMITLHLEGGTVTIYIFQIRKQRYRGIQWFTGFWI